MAWYKVLVLLLAFSFSRGEDKWAWAKKSTNEDQLAEPSTLNNQVLPRNSLITKPAKEQLVTFDVAATTGLRDGQAEPRFLKKAMCDLGLGSNCYEGRHSTSRHSYGGGYHHSPGINPADIGYVQPVQINPAGGPVLSIPLSHPLAGGYYPPSYPPTAPSYLHPAPSYPPPAPHYPPPAPHYPPPAPHYPPPVPHYPPPQPTYPAPQPSYHPPAPAYHAP
ncbi:unnamed protein product, partial [Meganyctiphanes norvegica]